MARQRFTGIDDLPSTLANDIETDRRLTEAASYHRSGVDAGDPRFIGPFAVLGKFFS
jgi:hypothetical protein